MKTAMLEAKKQTEMTGQSTTVFTADLQLYRVGLEVEWVYPDIFGTDFIMRLGGMHILMNFVGCIGVLLSGSDLEEVLKAGFGGDSKC